MFTKRILSGAVLISIIAAALYIDWRALLPFSLCGVIITVFIALGLYEFFTMLEKKGVNIYKYVGIGIGVLIPLSMVSRFEPTKKWELLFIVLILLFLILMQFRRRQNSGVVIDISTTLFGILYVSWFFSFLIKIIYLPYGMGLLTAVLLMTKLGDIGAYFVGSRLGKNPLLPRISPKKTVEGSIGGLIFSVIGGLVCKPFLPFSYLHLAFLGLGCGIIGQLGDLSESLIKRDCQVKDSGNIIPGMGGILDEIDSILFTAPAFYFYMSVVLK
ncbi:MAG: phosphatidate cytidylyltransferase [Candidatus Omnitrophica bacterium]|nr:phosphatidate cytidylyltransferase [Candidatus Omnitrophota bacterium]